MYGNNSNQSSGPYGGGAGGGYYSGSAGATKRKSGAPSAVPGGTSSYYNQQQSQQGDPFGVGSQHPSEKESYSQWNPSSASSTGSQEPVSATPVPNQDAAPSYWNPATAAAAVKMVSGGGNDAAIDLARQVATQFAVDGWARFIPGLESFMTGLRIYFAVDNKYVQRKIITTFFPFLKKNWRRTEVEAKTNADGSLEIFYALPNMDENAPDLYLPIMSLVTYCILCALLYGASGEFNSEVLPDVMFKCFATQILEVLAIRLGLYLMQTKLAMLDLFSYTGYKYMGLCVNILIGIAAGRKAYYGALLWTAGTISFMMLKVMANNIPRQTSAAGPKREFMVLTFAGSQFATMWFLSETKFLA